jgi:hypothetical protein
MRDVSFLIELTIGTSIVPLHNKWKLLRIDIPRQIFKTKLLFVLIFIFYACDELKYSWLLDLRYFSALKILICVVLDVVLCREQIRIFVWMHYKVSNKPFIKFNSVLLNIIIKSSRDYAKVY